MGRGRSRFFLQHRIFQEVILGEIIHRLRHLLEVKDLGPARISGTLSGLQLCLDVHQQIDLRRSCLQRRFFPRCMLLLTGENRQQVLQTVTFAQAVQTRNIIPFREFQKVRFATPGYLAPRFLKQLQQLIQIGGVLCQRIVNANPQLLPMRSLGLIAQPLVIAFSMRLWIFHNGQSFFNADGIAQSADSFCAAPKVPKFPVTVQIDRRPDNVIMDVRFINMGTDDKCVFALGKPVGKLHSQPVGFLCGDLAGTEGLPDMIGNHIVRSPHPPGGRNVLALRQ